MTPFNRSCTSSYWHSCGPISYHFQDKARYLSKIAIFHTPCTWCPHVGMGLHVQLEYKVWYGKSKMVSLPDCGKSDDAFARFDTIHESDRQRDRQTLHDSIDLENGITKCCDFA